MAGLYNGTFLSIFDMQYWPYQLTNWLQNFRNVYLSQT